MDRALKHAKDRPFVGGGFELEYVDDGRWLEYGSDEYRKFMIAKGSNSAAAHSIYFQILGQHGFVAFFIYLWLLVSVHLTLLRIRAISRRSADTVWIGTYATGLLVGLLGYVVSGSFLSSAYFDLAWLYFALGAVLLRGGHRRGAKSRSRIPGSICAWLAAQWRVATARCFCGPTRTLTLSHGWALRADLAWESGRCIEIYAACRRCKAIQARARSETDRETTFIA